MGSEADDTTTGLVGILLENYFLSSIARGAGGENHLLRAGLVAASAGGEGEDDSDQRNGLFHVSCEMRTAL